MAKVVFTQKSESVYDDLPEKHYQFPKSYLKAAEQAIKDWVVYYRPRRGSVGNLMQPASSYFAVARLVDIQPDRNNADRFYALVSDYLEFDQSVSFRRDEGSYEVNLLKADGSVNKGQFGRSVRVLDDGVFEAILQAGFSLGTMPWESIVEVAEHEDGDRPIVEQIIKRPYRDRHFRLQVCKAYQNICAVTGLSLINGGGRPEVQAAHIKPVASQGPDSVRNGLALSGTAHWLFDPGLITLDADMRLVVSASFDAQMYGSLLVPGRRIHLPLAESDRPGTPFTDYHREHIFHD